MKRSHVISALVLVARARRRLRRAPLAHGPKPNIVILATGGTIAGAAASGTHIRLHLGRRGH